MIDLFFNCRNTEIMQRVAKDGSTNIIICDPKQLNEVDAISVILKESKNISTSHFDNNFSFQRYENFKNLKMHVLSSKSLILEASQR